MFWFDYELYGHLSIMIVMYTRTYLKKGLVVEEDYVLGGKPPSNEVVNSIVGTSVKYSFPFRAVIISVRALYEENVLKYL